MRVDAKSSFFADGGCVLVRDLRSSVRCVRCTERTEHKVLFLLMKRKAEEEERGRGLALRFSAMQGMIPTEQLCFNNTENASFVTYPRQKRKKRC